jgi:hypothetical protein
MTATVLHRSAAPRSLGERAWAVVSAFLTKLAEADIRAKQVEPFGL